MPQQTSLLGMLRFLILRNAGNEVFANDKIVSTYRASSLIGYESFKVNNGNHEKNSFGRIESITPCFLIDEYGHVAVSCNVDPAKFDMKSDEQTIASINGMTIHVPKNQYNPKDADEDPLSDYFKTDQRIGLNKDYSGEKKQKNDDTDLFKQINYRLNEEKKLKFAFYANVDSDVPLSEYDGQIVTLGADSSTFVIGIKQEKYIEATVRNMPTSLSVVLCSPAYIESDELSCVAFATTSVISFRFLSSTVETKSYHRLGGEIKRNEKFNMYDTGSVFYFNRQEDLDSFVRTLCGYEDFRQIGYNYYVKNKQ